MFYLRFGILENSPKTVKCVINFATDCRNRERVSLLRKVEIHLKVLFQLDQPVIPAE